uniref:Integrase catalytic domain-containing protein n=1 Tax=Fagus sylvatica TaxID=28930 RepID=A0A2N9F3E8_FAGSY
MEPSAERLVEFPMVVFAFTIKWRRKQANSEDWKARVAALETKFNFLLQFIRRWTEREEEKKKATISKRQKEIYPALSLSKAAQTLPTPRRPAFHIPRPSRTEPRQFQPLPIPVPQLYTLLIKKKMITPCQPEDAYRATAQRLQQRPDLSEGYSTAPRAPKESTEAGTCQYHPGARDHNLQGCEEFKKEVAGLITKGLIRRRGEQPERDCMTIDQLRLSPYEKTNFQARMERIEEDFRGILSGRCYTPEELEKRKERKAGKAVEDPTKTKAAEEEAADFLRIIKSSEYSIVKQLSKMPSHISVLSLLLASESHRKALLKVLNEAYVPEDITGPSFENMVTSILVTNQLTFSDDELPPEGRGHTKALYISVKTNDRIVSRSADRQWGDHGYIQPEQYPSSLHQKMKLIIGNQLVTILAEEPISIYNDGEIPYIDGCAPEEASFHSGVSAWARFRLCEPRKNHNCDPGGKQRQVWTGVYPDLEGIVRWPYEARRQRAAAKLKRREMAREEDGHPPHPHHLPRISNMKKHLMKTPGKMMTSPTCSHTLMVPRGLDTLEFEIFCEHGDPESHLRKYREKMALHTNNEFLMISTFHESLPECAVTWFYQLKNLACWEGFGEELSWTDTMQPVEHPHHSPRRRIPPPHHRPATANREKKSRRGLAYHCYSVSQVAMSKRYPSYGQNASPSNKHCAGMKPEVILKIKEEVEKQLKAGFLSTVTYSDWVANIVPVPKKDGKVRMCVDYRDLNRASPKDNFPLPHIDTLVDNTATNVVFSFMDGFSGYNQIKMAEEDKSKTAFVTHWGTFVYDVMPFGLKNAGATYQRAMVTLFHDMIHHEIEVYVDDMIAKSRTAQDHLTDLRKAVPAIEEVSAQIKPEQVCLRRHIRKVIRLHRQRPGELRLILQSLRQPASEPLFKLLLRKDVKIKWTEDCQKAFDKIKEYLLNPPILVPPTPGRPLILYLTVQEASMGCMLGQQDETGKKEQAIYYLSKKFTEPETRYLLVEKTCCALAWASKKLRQYMLYYTTWLVSRMDPIKYIFEKPALTGKIARWQVLLSEVRHLVFVARKAIKGQAIADYLADYPSEQLELMDSEFPDEDVMTVDEDNHGRDNKLLSLLSWGFDCTNNMTEYEACIVGLQAALEFGAYELEVFGDSLLIVSQTNGEWQASGSQAHPVPTIHQPASPKVQMQKKPNRLIQEMHAGLMGAHANGPFLARKIMRAGYYWLTMERDCIRHVQTCHKCQMYQNSKNAPPQYLHTMASPWPFSAWGMDVIGAITPKASNGHEFILVAIDYFTKWVEACSFKNVTQVAVTRFVKNNIICRYGMPEMLITDNASNLNNRMMDQLCQQFKIQHHNSAPYRPKMNGAVEAANKNVKKILSKMTETYKDWHEHLPYAFVCLPNLEEAEWAQARYEQLNFIDEKRLAALCHGQLYQRRIERAYNKKARPRTFQPGDLVLKKRNMALSDPRGKFAPSYEGPYVVKKAFSGGAIILADMDGEEFRSPINSDSVIKYHV